MTMHCFIDFKGEDLGLKQTIPSLEEAQHVFEKFFKKDATDEDIENFKAFMSGVEVITSRCLDEKKDFLKEFERSRI